jgi:hypothetical protein
MDRRSRLSRRELVGGAAVNAGFHRTIPRRQFVLGAGVAGGGLLVGRCGPLPFQQPPPTPGKVYRLGFLGASTPAATAAVVD